MLLQKTAYRLHHITTVWSIRYWKAKRSDNNDCNLLAVALQSKYKVDIFFLFICDIHYKELMCGLSYASLWTYLHCISNKVIKLHFPECLTFLVVMWWCWWVITVKKWNILHVNRQIETVQWNFIGMGLRRLKCLCILMFVHRFLFCLCSPEIYWAK